MSTKHWLEEIDKNNPEGWPVCHNESCANWGLQFFLNNPFASFERPRDNNPVGDSPDDALQFDWFMRGEHLPENKFEI